MDIFSASLSYDPKTGLIRWKDCGKTCLNGSVAGSMAVDGYWMIRVNQKNYRAHRIAWLLAHGAWPSGEIDHINGVRADNRLENLRVVSSYENSKNKGIGTRNTTGVIGVCWNPKKRRWIARIKSDGVHRHIGSFVDKKMAIDARKAAEVELGFHPNHGRATA